MLASRPRRLRVTLLAGSCAVVVAALAPARGVANDCVLNNLFQMGTTNTCNTASGLSGSAPVELTVLTTATGGSALDAFATALTGSGRAVVGSTYSADTRAKASASTARPRTGLPYRGSRRTTGRVTSKGRSTSSECW